jgi:hypothetical protein
LSASKTLRLTEKGYEASHWQRELDHIHVLAEFVHELTRINLLKEGYWRVEGLVKQDLVHTGSCFGRNVDHDRPKHQADAEESEAPNSP